MTTGGGTPSVRARRRSLVRRFAGALLLPVLLGLLPLGLFLNARLRGLLEEGLAERQAEELLLLERALAARWPSPAAPESVDPIVDDLAAGLEGRITVVAPDGRVLGDSEVSGAELRALANHALRPEIEQAVRRGEGLSSRFSTSLGERFLYRARALRAADGTGLGVVRLAFSRAEIEREGERAALSVGAALLATLLLASGLAGLLARRLTRPIQLLRSAASRMARGEPGHLVRLRTGDELEGLAEDVNRMSQELARQRDSIAAEKEQLQSVLQGMVEGVLVTGAEGRIVQTNGALQRMFGLARAPVGKTTLEALRSPALEEALDRAARRGEPVSLTVRLSPADRHLQVGVAPLGRNGEGQGAVAVFHDITRLKKLEEVRRDFVANVSHEIRTPVAAIRGYAETLRDAAPSAEERARFADVVIRHADRLTHLVDDLLALASLESADFTLRVEPLAAAELLASVEEAFRPRAAERGVALAVEPPAAGLDVRGDRRLLEQVLGNLVDNAVEHTEAGGRVTLSAAEEPGGVVFRVADTGCGIPAADLDRVFERFFRVDRARSRRRGGTGLGLAIVKHIVLRHGGEVRVRSRLGEGSEFSAVLPRVGAPQSAELASPPELELTGSPE